MTSSSAYWMWERWREHEHDAAVFGPLLAEGVDQAVDGFKHLTPSKSELRAAGPASLLEGFVPERPIIDPETRVIAFGSCFAATFAQWLAENGFNRAFEPDSDVSLVRTPLDNPAVVAQQFRWAFDEFDPLDHEWFTHDKERYEASEARRTELRAILEAAEVMIITLGLTEVWVSRRTGEVTWRIPPRPQRQGKFFVKWLTVAECVQAFEEIERLRQQHMPNTKIVYSVSPVRLYATTRPMSAITANVIGKSTLRAAVDEFLRSRPELLNTTYIYYPSYEIAKELFQELYEDNLHLYQHHSKAVVELFARHYTTLPLPDPAEVSDPGESSELFQALVSLEEARDYMQGVAEDRLVVIEEVNAAALERQALIQEMHAAALEQQALIEGLTTTVEAQRTALAGRIPVSQAEIEALERVAADRLSLIGDLERVADERLALIEALDASLRRITASRLLRVLRGLRGATRRITFLSTSERLGG